MSFFAASRGGGRGVGGCNLVRQPHHEDFVMATENLVSKQRGQQKALEAEIFSRPVMPIVQNFKSQQSQYLAIRTFDVTDRVLYYFAGHFLHRGMDEAVLLELQEQIIAKFDEYCEECDKEIQRLNGLINGKGILKIPDIGYTKPEKTELKVSNPLTRRYLTTLLKLDEVCTAINAAWLTEAITVTQRTNGLFNYRNKLRRLCNTLAVQRNTVLRALNKENRAEIENQIKAKEGGDDRAQKARAYQAKENSAPVKKVEGVLRNADVKRVSKAVVEAKVEDESDAAPIEG